MLPSSLGRPMIVEAVDKLDLRLDDLIVTILKEHDEKFDARAGLRSAFGREIEIVVLDTPTKSQPETVSRTLKITGLDEPFLIKDSDNGFELPDIDQPYNYVSTASLNDFSAINPQNKSYVRVDETDIIVQIREKQVISDRFSVGGYFFRSPSDYVRCFEKLGQEKAPWQSELYTSDIIASMILEGEPFKSRSVNGYHDWGTLKEWRSNLQRRSTYFVVLDGFILERGDHHFAPRFDHVAANPQAVAAISALAAEGHKIIFLSIRPSSARAETEKVMQSLGLPTDDILFEMPIGRYSVISAPHETVPFTTALGLEISPDDPRLSEKLRFQD
jgi:hypothetical protein